MIDSAMSGADVSAAVVLATAETAGVGSAGDSNDNIMMTDDNSTGTSGTSTEAAGSAAAEVIPCPPTLSTTEERTLRSALAFVVLRRRLEGRLAAVSAADDANADFDAAADVADNHHASASTANAHIRKRPRDDIATGSALPFFTQRDPSDTCSTIERRGMPHTTSTRTITDKTHLSSLVRLAMSTALAMYRGDVMISAIPDEREGSSPRRDDYYCSNTNYSGQSVEDDHAFSLLVNQYSNCSSISRCVASALYDYQTAGTAVAQIGSSSFHRTTIEKYAVIDGLATSVASQLGIVASSSTDAAVEIVRQELLDIILEDGIGNSIAPPPGGHGGISCHDNYEYVDDNVNVLEKTRLVSAICTFLHRVCYCAADGDGVVSTIIVAVCSFLRHLYDGKAPSLDSVATGNNDYGGDDDDDDEDITTVTVIEVPNVADVAAVNLIILLEEVTLTRIHDLSTSGSEVLNDMTRGFGADLMTCPLQLGVKSAATYFRDGRLLGSIDEDEENRGEQILDRGAKLMLRLALWDLVGKLTSM
mmetsp:Transcript_29125/g.63225  ORF Transcript_29125/g.63225 Transcript_29125/m.63225 type:complete len:533 (-) Transcript_29125:908-2506(-)